MKKLSGLSLTRTTREIFWGCFFVIIGFVSFFGFVFAAVFSNDRHYCYLVPLTLPVIMVAVYFHWLSMKLFKHA
ncbi:hypothetical protein CARUB_v10027764mg [Capsella rubella]|uniref:Transmembrane protein n=1 Tax=Capsella rubella TaxID=81985 RepID=R0EZ36_9BRAS|nr:hypothetical protein CARUB_v10027764mg [Capsella rubella]